MNKTLTSKEDQQAERIATAFWITVIYASATFSISIVLALSVGLVYWGGGVWEELVLGYLYIPEPYHGIAPKLGYAAFSAYTAYRVIQQAPKWRRHVESLLAAVRES